jgi:hypothetical protein
VQIASTRFWLFLKNTGSVIAGLTEEEREALFREFLQWHEKNAR